MSDLAHSSPPAHPRRSDLRGLVEVFVVMQLLAALIWTLVMGLRPEPSLRGGETSVRGVVMEALAEHLAPPTAAVLVERPKPVKPAAPAVAKPVRRSSPTPARQPVTAWEPPTYPAPATAAYVPPPAPGAYAPAPRAYVPPPAPKAAPGWSDVAPPRGEH